VGDQLWAKIIGPAACGKSTLCEALSVSIKYVKAKSTIRGFHSGYRMSSDGSEDNSLISELRDKTLVTKDGDTLLQSPNLGQILSEARDIYDSVSRTHYRNKASKDYSGVRMTWLLCGTSSLRALDSSELGERFLDCVIMEKIDPDLEDEILWRVANRADRAMSFEASSSADTHYDQDLVHAMQLTGGYVNYLREHAQSLLDATKTPSSALQQCVKLGKFTAYMRARPSRKQDESAERELAARLVSQMVRLAKCLAVVLNKPRVDEDVMRRVTQVALDTARGKTLEIASKLYKEGRVGMYQASIAHELSEAAEEKLKSTLLFMRKIGIIERYIKKSTVVRSMARLRLTEDMALLFEQVSEIAGYNVPERYAPRRGQGVDYVVDASQSENRPEPSTRRAAARRANPQNGESDAKDN
jgi:hypothetical protein